MTETGNRINVVNSFTALQAVAVTVNHNGEAFQLLDVSIDFDAAPTTAEDITVIATTSDGFVKQLFTRDPSSPSSSHVRWVPNENQRFASGTTIGIAYTNTDGKVIETDVCYQIDQSVV